MTTPTIDPLHMHELMIRSAPHTFAEARSPYGYEKWVAAKHLAYISTRIVKAMGRGPDKPMRMLVAMPPRHGKALSHNTPILTTQGWKTHGDLRPGDLVYRPNGLPTSVIAVSDDVIVDIEIEFSNGATIKAHENHEWKIMNRARGVVETIETKDLIKVKSRWGGYLKKEKILRAGTKKKRCTYQLPFRSSIWMPKSHKQSLEPYFLGVWLGDGSASAASFCFADKDAAVLDAVKALGCMPSWSTVHKGTGVNYVGFRGVQQQLRLLGVFDNKHIPRSYKFASEAQRMELLAGLVDTDGHVELRTGRVRIVTVSDTLKDDLMELLRGLGWEPYCFTQEPTTSTSGIIGRRPVHTIGFQPDRPIPTRIPRKQIVITDSEKRRIGFVSAKKCTPVPGRCIQVAAEDGMYLAGRDLIPTHNSSLISKWLPIWFLDNFPTKRVMMCSYNEQLAMEWGRKVRDEFARNPKLWTKLREDVRSTTFWHTDKGGSMLSAGLTGGSLKGRGFHCLAAGNKVITELGLVDIADLVKTDIKPRVAAFDHEKNKVEWARILAWQTSFTDTILTIKTAKGAVIRCTSDHKFWILTKGYVEAKNIQPLDLVMTGNSFWPDNGVDNVTDIWCDLSTEKHTIVYDIQVERFSNFFVEGVLTHNCGIIDDPVKTQAEADSPVFNAANIQAFNSDFYTRREAGGAHIIVLMQRMNHNDLIGYLLREHKDPWEYISLPLFATQDNDCLGRKKGEVLWPEKFPLGEFTGLDALTLQTQYQQEPPNELATRVYHNYTDAMHLDQSGQDTALSNTLYNLPLMLAVDFNVNPGMHALIGQYIRTGQDCFRWRHEIHGHRMRTLEMIQGFWGIITKQYGGFRWPHLEIFGDRSGRTETTQTADTDYAQIEQFLKAKGVKYHLKVPYQNPPVKFRVQTVNDALQDQTGGIHMRIHKDCQRLITDMATQPTDVDGLPDKSNDLLGHAGDAVGYACVWLRPLRRLSYKPQKQIG